MDEPADPTGDRESAYELLQRGRELIRTRHPAPAAVVLERRLVQARHTAALLEERRQACYNSRQYERSREAFEELLEVDPSSHYGHFALGQSLKQLGRPAEARTHLRLAVALSPSSDL